MIIQTLSHLLAAILTFVIGWSVILRDARKRPHMTFVIFCFNLALWYLAYFFAIALGKSFMMWIALAVAAALPNTSERFFRVFLMEKPVPPFPPVSALTWTATVAS